LISALPPSAEQKRLAFLVVLVLSAGCILSIPFRHVQFARLDIFVPLLDLALFIIDVLTAALLYAHYSVLGSRALRILASGYLFTGLIIVAHGLTFPGAFSPTGLLGANLQSSVYLQTTWRAGLPCAAIAYALIRERDSQSQFAHGPLRGHILASIAVVFLAACALTWLVTAGAAVLPEFMIDTQQRTGPFDAPFIIPLEIAAIALVWWRGRSTLDLWLLVVLWAWLLATILVSMTTQRFSFVWYESRFYGLFASSLLLLTLLTQMATLYTRLAISITQQRRERDRRLMEVEATLSLVSHEINQPMTAIAMNGDAGLREIAKVTPDFGVLGSVFKDVIRDSHRAGEIIRGIRALFRHDEEKDEEINVAELVASALRLLRGDLQLHGVIVETAFGSGLPRVMGNKVQLQQVVLNLITNAIEAMDQIPGGPRVLHVGVACEGGRVLVNVEDSGPGIEPTVMDTIFDPFITTKSKGRGLGLSICRSIVEAHGGVLSSSPASPHGTVFRIALRPAAPS
jgi:signal transduction histidine kinase